VTEVVDLTPRGLEALKLRRPFTWLRNVPGFRRMHRHCGALGYWCCAGCTADIEEAWLDRNH